MRKHPVLLRAGKWLALAMVLCLAPLCFGESMVVKVLNGSDGGPVADQLVIVEFRSKMSAGEETRKILVRRVTDPSGEALIPVPLIKLEDLNIQVNFSAKGMHCSCRVQTEIETVIREGLIVPHRARLAKTSHPIQAGPGHIVFVARESSLLEKIVFEY